LATPNPGMGKAGFGRSTPLGQRRSTNKFRIIAVLSPTLITMGDSDIMGLFGGAFLVIALGGVATFWFLLR
jgi:hypothetical protein